MLIHASMAWIRFSTSPAASICSVGPGSMMTEKSHAIARVVRRMVLPADGWTRGGATPVVPRFSSVRTGFKAANRSRRVGEEGKSGIKYCPQSTVRQSLSSPSWPEHGQIQAENLLPGVRGNVSLLAARGRTASADLSATASLFVPDRLAMERRTRILQCKRPERRTISCCFADSSLQTAVLRSRMTALFFEHRP